MSKKTESTPDPPEGSREPSSGKFDNLAAEQSTEQEEIRFPVILIVVAVAGLLVLEYFRSRGLQPVIRELDEFSYLLHALANTVFGVIACYTIGYFLGTSFGSQKVGLIKLVAIVLFSLTIGLALMKLCPLLGLPLSAGFDLGGVFSFTFSLPIVMGFLAATILFYGFLRTFFDLELQDTIALMVAYLLVALGTRGAIHNVLDAFGG
jgi:hypothetical protein